MWIIWLTDLYGTGWTCFFSFLLLSIVPACVYLNLSRRKCRVEALSDHDGCWTGNKLWCECDVTQLFYTTSRSITLVIDNQVLSCALFLMLWLLHFLINKLKWWLQFEYSQCFNTKAKVKLLRTLCIILSTARFCATWTKDVWQRVRRATPQLHRLTDTVCLHKQLDRFCWQL